jgi:hypothetical protein
MELPHLAGLHLAEFQLLRQQPPADRLTDPVATLLAAVEPEMARLPKAARVAIAIGSRGIAHLPDFVAALVAQVRAQGCQPFIIPAMGSHGGGTAAGQTAVLEQLGVTEASASCPIHSSMETTTLGALHWNGTEYLPCATDHPQAIVIDTDATAHRDADLVIPLVRIKPHTGFRGPYESGICKMLTIGLGKHATCSRLHREGYARFAALIPAAARVVLAGGRIAFAVAILENAADEPADIVAVRGDAVMDREPELLVRAKALMPQLPFREIDVLVVERIGKDISGTGMDPNITGRSESGTVEGFTGPVIHRIVVLGLTTAAKGNATGIGMADVISEACFQAINRETTAVNVLTSGSLRGGRIPVAVPGETEAILAAAACVPGRTAADARIVRIRSTLDLREIAISSSLIPELAAYPQWSPAGAFTGWTRSP